MQRKGFFSQNRGFENLFCTKTFGQPVNQNIWTTHPLKYLDNPSTKTFGQPINQNIWTTRQPKHLDNPSTKTFGQPIH
jgi:hypothetical protein